MSSTSSLPTYGTCYSSSECNAKGGTADGNCASGKFVKYFYNEAKSFWLSQIMLDMTNRPFFSGFGVCCTFLVSTCGSTLDQNCTYIQNPSYPSSYSTSGTCEYAVTPLNSEICQIRLDMDAFDLTETSTTGVCVDSFDVTVGSSRDYYTLCGTLTGQHSKWFFPTNFKAILPFKNRYDKAMNDFQCILKLPDQLLLKNLPLPLALQAPWLNGA